MNARRLQRFLAITQGLVASGALCLVVYGYAQFAKPAEQALRELDAMAANAEREIATVVAVLRDVDQVLENFEAVVPAHQATLSSMSDATREIGHGLDLWKDEVNGFSEISREASQICGNFAAQLPIRIPAVDFDMQPVEVQVPQFTTKTRTLEIPYPTASVEMGTQKLKYPTASVETKEFRRGIGGLEVNFNYPSGIDLKQGEVTLDYPKSVKIADASKTIEVPATPDVYMHEYRFDLPGKVEVTYRDLMLDEKQLLQKTSARLASASESLGEAAQTLDSVQSMISHQVIDSLAAAAGNLTVAANSLTSIRTTKLPDAIRDLIEQQSQISSSRQVFETVGGLIPIAALVLALIPVALIASGASKYIAAQ